MILIFHNNQMLQQKTQLKELITEELANKHLSKDTLDLSIRRFQCIENISHLKRLKILNLSFNNIHSISGLSNLIYLEKLFLQHNLIEQIRGLEENKNLRVLHLMNNKIQKIEGLNGLIRLEEINLSNNKITRLTGIQTQNLVTLNLHNNLIESLEYLPVSKKLEELVISENRLSYIGSKVFNNCDKILRLNLSKNLLKSMKFADYLAGLEELNLGFNRLQSIDVESQFQYMETLVLNDNKIVQLPYLTNIFPDIMQLNVTNNILTSQNSFIQSISGLQSLITLNFTGNPFYIAGCEEKYSKLFKLETINERQILKPGEKYSSQISSIIEQWREFPDLYLKDKGLGEEQIKGMNEIKKDGFYSEELEKFLVGEVSKRPVSPNEKYPINEDRVKHQQQMYKEIQDTAQRIKYLQLTYKQIMKKHNPISKSQTFITHKQTDQKSFGKPTEKKEPIVNSKGKDKPLSATMSLNEMNRITETIKAQRQASIEKWKQIKKNQKLFNIRQLKKKNTNQQPLNESEMQRQRPNLSLPKIITRSQKPSSKFVKTQTNNFQAVPSSKMNFSYRRPPSAKKT